jgi:arylsulfatase A-like enzyme
MLVGCVVASAPTTVSPAERPNVVLILADDLGYGDLGVGGATGFTTPHVERVAAEGIRFTSFYVAVALCSPSRAALLSGCYPQRVGVPGGIGPQSKTGIASPARLLPESLKEAGYRTALIGKWHLGHLKPFLPRQRGFDEFFGTPASNDTAQENTDPAAGKVGRGLLLFEGNRVIEIDPDQALLTRRYAERAVKFIEDNRTRPFFLYVAFNAPHTPLAVSDRFKGGSARGLYGDVVMELDWAVGEVMAALKRVGTDDRTLVIFTSDNGPWLIFGDHGGSAGPLRGGKKQTFEGGVRVPCIMRWPGQIAAGRVSSELVAAMDLLPTIVGLTGGRLPDYPMDGFDVWPLLSGQSSQSPRSTFHYFWQTNLHAIRSGKWKLQLPHVDTQAPEPRRIGHGGQRGEVMTVKRGLALYDLEQDIGETTDLSGQFPAVVRELSAKAGESRSRSADPIGRRGNAGQ